MYKKIFILFIMIFLSYACKQKNQFKDGYSIHANGFYYKLIAIGDGSENPTNDHVVVLDAVMRTQNDSVFWDTGHDSPNGLYVQLNNTELKASCLAYFKNMVEGDSVSFMMPTKTFFKVFFDTIVPNFCIHDTLTKVDVKLSQIISVAEYQAMQQTAESVEREDTELQELQRIDSYLTNNYPNVKADANGIYILEKTITNNAPIIKGNKVSIEFQGFFLDGRPLDKQPQKMEFIYGTPDQLIQGLNIVIAFLKKGENAKIILPSRMAFGEHGSSNGSVQPYTPILYNLKITDIQ